MTKTMHWLTFLLVLTAPTGCSQEVKILVENPSAFARPGEPVVVAWSSLAGKFSGGMVSAFRLVDENGKEFDLQVDDLDLDSTPDELTFLADLGARQQQSFLLTRLKGDNTSNKSERPFHTDAQNWKRINGQLGPVDDDDLSGDKRIRSSYRFDGVGWESDVIAYRLYLDERNAVDIQGKRKPGLYWKWIGESGVDYQLDADWGMDVLHVGPALGVGGIAFWSGDSVVKPVTVDRERCRVVARGPVRAVVRVDYTGWNVGGKKLDVTSLFTISAGDRVCEHRVLLGSGAGSAILATGIVTHDSTDVLWEPGAAYLATIGHQSRANDTLLMALNVLPSSVVKKTEDPNNQLLLLTLEEGKPARILISSYWQGETGSMWGDDQTVAFLQSVARRLAEPLMITLR